MSNLLNHVNVAANLYYRSSEKFRLLDWTRAVVHHIQKTWNSWFQKLPTFQLKPIKKNVCLGNTDEKIG